MASKTIPELLPKQNSRELEAKAFLESIIAPNESKGSRNWFGVVFGKRSKQRLNNGKRPIQYLKTEWFRISEKAICEASRFACQKADAGYEVYFTVARFRKQRRIASNALRTSCLWADIDFAEYNPDSAKPYPTKNAVFDSFRKMAFPPSIIVSTGNGCHAYWLLHQSILVSQYPDIVKQWQKYLQHCFDRIIDSTGDFSRIMRIPGTYNHACLASNTEVPSVPIVTQKWEPELRYTVSSLVEVMNRSGIAASVRHQNQPRFDNKRSKRGSRQLLSEADRKAIQSIRRNAKFGLLWKGEWRGAYPSQSEADLALCAKIAFFIGNDPTRIDSIFRCSGLFRPKWDTRHGSNGKTYGEMTIEKAVYSQARYAVNASRKRSTGIDDFIRYGWRNRLSKQAFNLYLGIAELEEQKGVRFGDTLFSGVREQSGKISASPNRIKALLNELSEHGLIKFSMGTPDKKIRHATEIRRMAPIPKQLQHDNSISQKTSLSLSKHRKGNGSQHSNCHCGVIHINTEGGCRGNMVYSVPNSTDPSVLPVAPIHCRNPKHTIREIEDDGWIEEIRYAFE